VHSNPMTLRSYALGGIRGTFFTVDLARAKRTFETAPWIRRAVVRRVWPNGLMVEIAEHQPVALWSSEGQERLVNQQGEVFDANAADVDEDLPRFVGPSGSSSKMLSFFERLNASLEPRGTRATALLLDARSEWVAETDEGYSLLLGRDDGELWARLDRFLSTREQASARLTESSSVLGGQWSRVDLRHKMGYAVALGRERSIIDSDATNSIVNNPSKKEPTP
jgi:cell division protein FtsQ